MIDSMGVDICVLIDFSGDFSKLAGRSFLSMLSEGGALRFLAVGRDFRCGHGLDTDARAIRSFCEEGSIEVELLEPVQRGGHPVSSSRIRKAVLEGRLEEASQMLGRPYEIDLKGARSLAPGRLLPGGDQAKPPPGKYEAIAWPQGRNEEASMVATLGEDGAWSIAHAGHRDEGGAALGGLRLLSMVSRG